MSSRYRDVYYNKFAHSYLLHSKEEQKLEGFLFGYPSCCVQQFLRKPYTDNGFNKNDQAKLFHWACPQCRVTTDLIPYYTYAYNKVRDNYEYCSDMHKRSFSARYVNFPAKIAATMTSVLLSSGLLSAQTAVDSTHIIPIGNDVNQNNLTYEEEIWLGHFDMSTLAESQLSTKKMAKYIDALPVEPSDEQPIYRVDHLMRGVYQCAKCDSIINMGFVTIINTKRQLQIDLPYMALHFMQHGSFSWANIQDSYFSRVDIDTLKSILHPYDIAHILPVNNDRDGDGLTDSEEDSLSVNYTADNPDFDGNGVPDGAQLAEELIRLFPKLKEQADDIHSHVSYNLLWGLEQCKICGTSHNMGTVTISNPENGRQCEIPIIALHAMAHGSFTYDGTVHKNQRTNVIQLLRSVKTHMLHIKNDADADGLAEAEEITFGYDPNKADSNENGVCDGRELATQYVDIIKSLPAEPRIDGPYTQYLGMDGIHICSVCGEQIVMGLWQIYNPLINTAEPLEIREYAMHFMAHGSFAFNGALKGRTGPQALANYLGVVTHTAQKTTPSDFYLKQNYPNPFNQVTTIEYHIPANSHVNLSVYSVQGQKIATLVHKQHAMGNYKVAWNAAGFSSGVYLCKLVTEEGFSSTKKLILLK